MLLFLYLLAKVRNDIKPSETGWKQLKQTETNWNHPENCLSHLKLPMKGLGKPEISHISGFLLKLIYSLFFWGFFNFKFLNKFSHKIEYSPDWMNLNKLAHCNILTTILMVIFVKNVVIHFFGQTLSQSLVFSKERSMVPYWFQFFLLLLQFFFSIQSVWANFIAKPEVLQMN